MTSYAALPKGGEWFNQGSFAEEFRGTKAGEMLAPKSERPTTIVGGGGADHLFSTEGKTTFKYNRLSDSLSTRPDIIFSFNPKMDKIDVSDVLRKAGIEKINYVPSGQELKNIGDGYLSVDSLRMTTLRVKVKNHGPDFMIKVDGTSVGERHIIESKNKPVGPISCY